MTPRRTPALLHPFARPAAEPGDFLTLVRGEGACVVDTQGRRYVDAMASLWHCNVGHGRKEVADAYGEVLASLPSEQVPPVTLLTGALDAKFTALARASAARWPHARATTIAAAGHNVPLEAPAALALAVREALDLTNSTPREP